MTKPLDVDFWWHWVLVNSITWACYQLIMELVSHPYRGDTAIFFGFLIGGFILGISQAYVLRKRINQRVLWAVLTSIGFMMPAMADRILHIFSPGIITVLLLGVERGLAIGILQYFILRCVLREAWWWIPTMVLTESIIIPFIVGGFMIVEQRIFGVGGLIQFTIHLIFSGAVGGSVAGCLTGFVLIRLFRKTFLADTN